ncbi:MAG: response regulator transcription factor [Kiritimatiellae bacterium]|nr:response regulator transcription factor [Kiritimatiellia bacterium]
MSYIIFAEDDATLRNGIETTLASEGYEVLGCKDGNEALEAFARRQPDLLLLDVMMPNKSGYDVCVEIRRINPTLPIIFLTAKSSEADIVIGLGLGADDFIAKPFRLRELLARVASALRRSQLSSTVMPAPGIFCIGEAKIDARRFLVFAPDKPEQSLTIRELGLLRTLAEHPGEVMTRDALLNKVWGLDYSGTNRTLDQHIMQIRRKLGSSGNLIETLRGVGYRLKENKP